MKHLTFALFAAAGLLMLSACATPTPYQAAVDTSTRGYHPGYSETKVEDGRYRLSFAGNDTTTRQTVEDYMLYRAAELTLEQGYDWFEIVKRDTDAKTRTMTTYDDPFNMGVSWRFYRGNRWGGWGLFEDDFNRDTVEYTRYEAVGEILMHKGAKPEGSASAYDARSVKQNLEPRIIRPVAH